MLKNAEAAKGKSQSSQCEKGNVRFHEERKWDIGDMKEVKGDLIVLWAPLLPSRDIQYSIQRSNP